MLVLLTPDQVSSNWPKLKEKILKHAPPVSSDGDLDMNKVLEAILGGGLQLWMSVSGDKVTTVIITQVLKPVFSSKGTLLLYSLFTVGGRHSTKEEWIDGYESMVLYARSKNCSRIVAYSDNEKIIGLAEHFNWNSKWRFLMVEV